MLAWITIYCKTLYLFTAAGEMGFSTDLFKATAAYRRKEKKKKRPYQPKKLINLPACVTTHFPKTAPAFAVAGGPL